MKGRRYIFTPYQNLLQTRFSRLHKISDRLVILVKGDDMIPASLVRKTHKLRKRLKWVYLKEDSLDNMHYHWMYLLGKADAKAADNVEFVLLSNNEKLDSVIKRLNEGGRKCIRIPFSGDGDELSLTNRPKKTAGKTAAQEEPLMTSDELPEVEKVEPKEAVRPDPMPPREGIRPISDEEVIATAARETLEKLHSTGQRPENLETLKHYIHLFSTSSVNRRVSIDQILDYMEAQREILIYQGLVTYNF